ncbi:hypothetical protein [Ensifer sp. MJa1]|uniref:hypothetical protein n=1 Tax=Ensifer sp. MJa1 TaxID=2919888 RepID=UPI00300B3918
MAFVTRSTLPRRPRETLNDLHELAVRSTAGIAKLVDLVFVGEPVQAHKLASAQSLVQLQLGWPMGEHQPPHFCRAQELAEFRRRHIDQEQNEYPERWR